MSVFPLMKFWAGKKKNNSQRVELRKLRVEALEERQMLDASGSVTGFDYINKVPYVHVTTLDDVVNPDDNVISLREALNYVNGSNNTTSNAHIDFRFEDAVTNTTINTTNQLYINRAVTLDGTILIRDENNNYRVNEKCVTIDGGGDVTNTKHRIFEINQGANNTKGLNITLNNLNLQNGRAIDNNGGAILINKNERGTTITLNNIEFNNNIATNTGTTTNAINGCGGALYVPEKATIHATNVAFRNNGSDTQGKYGGAICNKGVLNITEATFSNNTARLGGAIYNRGTLSVTGSSAYSCSFNENKANADIVDGTYKYGSGGAIYNSAGSATFQNVQFNNNTADKYGGAISNFAVGDANSPGLSLNSVICEGNEAGEGGALHNSGIATVANFSAEGNVAIKRDSFLVEGDKGGNGGAIYQANSDKYSSSTLTITNGSFWANKAKNAGGAIDIVSGSVTFNGAFTLTNNKAGTKTENAGNNSANYGIGGAIVAVGSVSFDANPTFNFGVDTTHPKGTNEADYAPTIAATANYGGTNDSRITDLKNGFFPNNQNVDTSLFAAFVQERQANTSDQLTFAYFADSVGVVRNSQGEVVNVQSVHVSTDQNVWTELTGAVGEEPFTVTSPTRSGGVVDVYYYVNDNRNYVFTLSFSITSSMNMAVQRIDNFVGLSSGTVGFSFTSFGSKPISEWMICWDYTGKEGDEYVPYSKYGYSLNAFNWYEDNKPHQIGLKVILEGETEPLPFGAVATIPARGSQGTTDALLDETSLTNDFFADEELIDDLFVL